MPADAPTKNHEVLNFPSTLRTMLYANTLTKEIKSYDLWFESYIRWNDKGEQGQYFPVIPV